MRLLATAHATNDMLTGALAALLPFLAAEHGYGYAQLGGLLLAAGACAAVLQPLLGWLSDRVALWWAMPVALVLVAIGTAAIGLMPSYGTTLCAVVVGGIGSAAFHPEGARYANLASGAQRGRGMSLFSVGGNLGIALGPLLATPLVLAFGLAGTLGLAAPPLLAAVALVRHRGVLERLRADAAPLAPAAGALDAAPPVPAAAPPIPAAAPPIPAAAPPAAAPLAPDTTPSPAHWGAFGALTGVIALRTAVYTGLQAFAPIWFVTVLGSSEAVGNGALTLMLLAGAAGNLVGGRLSDRFGGRTVLSASLACLAALLVLLPLGESVPLAAALLVLAGIAALASFGVTVLMGQQYLPHRLGLAAGVSLGFAIGAGGLGATLLGLAADRWGVATVMWILAALPLPALALALALPAAGGAARPVRISAASRSARRWRRPSRAG